MKKKLVGLLLIIILLISAIYIFIPNILRVKNIVTISCTPDGIYRALLSNRDWSKWWPATISPAAANIPGSNYTYNNHIYQIENTGYAVLLIGIKNDNFDSKLSMTVVPKERNLVELTWESSTPTSYNPIRRLQIYLASRDLNKDNAVILERIKSYFGNPGNIYSTKIRVELLKDSFLVSTSSTSKNYPSPNEVYTHINKLKNYISGQSATATGYPMLHIIKQDGGSWLTKVAVPTNRMLESSGDISFKGMPGFGKLLMAEVKGGDGTIKNVVDQMEIFANDYHYSTPGIPFQSLVTDRTKETDTSKWITRIYYPVQ